MGPEKQPIGEFYIDLGDGEFVKLEGFPNGDLEITCPDEAPDDPLFKVLKAMSEPLTFGMTVTAEEVGKAWRCGSRKRFIKLLMSYGCDRNTAHEMAAIVPILRGQKSYQELLFEALFLFSKMVEAAEQHERTETT